MNRLFNAIGIVLFIIIALIFVFVLFGMFNPLIHAILNAIIQWATHPLAK